MVRNIFAAVSLICLWVTISCSGSPVAPGVLQPGASSPDAALLETRDADAQGYNRVLWGYWTMRWNPDTQRLEATPCRSGELHLNVIKFLEYTLCKTCLVIGDNQFNADGDLEVEIGVHHPIKQDGVWSASAFSGFDVRGIAIFGGTYYFDEHALLMSRYANNEFTLVNADGYTELWSPFAFAPGTIGRPIFEYFPGKYEVNGTKLTTTLNPFRTFYTLSERRTFEAGKNETKIFTLRFPYDLSTAPLEFGYAVDASWVRPVKTVNPDVPDDFPISANSIEAYRIDAEFSGFLTPEGGELLTILRVYDWQGSATIDEIKLEAPDLFNGIISPSGPGIEQDQYVEYTVDVSNDLLAPVGTYPLLISVSDTNTVPIIGAVKAHNVFYVPVDPPLSLQKTLDPFENLPIAGYFDSDSKTCYFCPVPFTTGLSVMGIDENLEPVIGFPSVTAMGALGLCVGTREILLATDSGGADDVTVYDIDTRTLKQTFDIPSLVGNPGTMPLDFVVYEPSQEVWTTLAAENEVGVFFAGLSTSSPDITRIGVGTIPTTMAIDTTNYRVFAACDGNDTVAVLDGDTHTLASTITLSTPLESPDPVHYPATPGMAYVPDSDMLYVTMLLRGRIEYYDLTDDSYKGAIQLAPDGTEIILGLVYDPTLDVLIATGNVISGQGHLYMIDPNTNTLVYTAETSGMNPSFPGLDSPNHLLFVPDPIGKVDVFKIVR